MKNIAEERDQWPRVITHGRIKVSVYRRKAPKGNHCYMVANYADGKRRFDSYPSEAEAIEAANKLARQMSEREVMAAAMTNGQASDYANAIQKLAPFNVSLVSTADAVAECLKLVGGLGEMQKACSSYHARQKNIISKPVAEVVAELIAVKEQRGVSVRYTDDLRFRLGRVAEDFRKNICDVSTADIQMWLDSQKFRPQSYKNFRTVINLLFEFAVARHFASENPVVKVERIKVRSTGDIMIFTPEEIKRLLAGASPNFLPCIAIGAFAGLRSAEIERLEWQDVDFDDRQILVRAGNAKTGSRRFVPMSENLALWLQPYAKSSGKIWQGTHDGFYDAEKKTAKLSGLKWKRNALRHSLGSYMFAILNDAGRLSGYMGSSPSVIHRHYRQVVKPAEAKRWFEVKPEPIVKELTLPKKILDFEPRV